MASARTGTDLRLAMIGTGPLLPAVQAAITELGLDRLVTLLGDRPNPYPILALCPYGLLTSDTEGFPNILMEMMACGVGQIVTTPCAGDLDHLHGVQVAGGFSAAALAQTLADAVSQGVDHRNAYGAALQARSLDGFIARILGEAESVSCADSRLASA